MIPFYSAKPICIASSTWKWRRPLKVSRLRGTILSRLKSLNNIKLLIVADMMNSKMFRARFSKYKFLLCWEFHATRPRAFSVSIRYIARQRAHVSGEGHQDVESAVWKLRVKYLFGVSGFSSRQRKAMFLLSIIFRTASGPPSLLFNTHKGIFPLRIKRPGSWIWSLTSI